MFCPNCGVQTPTGAKFCMSCGAPISSAQSENTSPGMAAAPSAPPVFTPGPIASTVPERHGFAGWLRGLRLWQKIALGVVVFIVAVISLAMWATSGLDEPVQRHFAALRAGNIVAAYSELSVAAQKQTSLDDFKKMVEGMPALTHVTGQSFSTRETNNGQGHVQGVLELEGGGKLPIDIQLVKENGDWKILGYNAKSATAQR